MLYFFLSYARGDDNVWVKKFYIDLCAELRTYAGVRGRDDQIGFFDSSSIGMGQDWSAQLVEALSTCQVLLFLATPAYFRSEPCGKELQAFADRAAAYERTTGRTPPALLPILWLPMSEDRMHPAVTNLQNHTARLGEPYRQVGLRQLIRLQRNKDAYLEFLSELAVLIVDTADQHPIPIATTRPTFHEINSMFQPKVSGGTTDYSIPDLASMPTSQYVHFVVAAPSRAEIAGLRRQAMFYGEQSVDWSPYRPTFPFPLGQYAHGIATDRSFQAEVATIDHLSERIDKATENNQIVILLVDVWVTRLDAYRDALAEYTQREQAGLAYTTAVMIPWNHKDEETVEHRTELAVSISDVFSTRTADGGDVMYRKDILSSDSFQADLRDVLEVAKNHIFVKGKVYRRPTGEDPGERPILEGP